MRAFVVRPFGEKNGVDFDRVERELIQPALRRLSVLLGDEVHGGTTVEINRAGNIRQDMFRLLVVADLVIADVSIHNANVFYELGIRHALRTGHTFMLRSNVEGHKYPFDLQTDRYLLYDASAPGGGKTVEDLAQALRSTVAAASASSPVFQLLPQLQAHDRNTLVSVPRDFAEDVERARRDRQRGDLRLFAQEVATLEWDQEGLLLIGEAQFKLRALNGAKETFEALRTAAPDSLRANWRLGTIYQKLAFEQPPEHRADLLARSDQAIARALAAAKSPADRAEVRALRASNTKSRWIDEFRAAPDAERQATALCSVHLTHMLEDYLRAVAVDLDAYYPGINALGLLLTQMALAKAQPDVWAHIFDSDAQAAAALAAKEQLAARISSTLVLALNMDDTIRALDEQPDDPWAACSRADLLLLTLANRPQRVAQAYREALASADRFALEATRRNLAIFKDLGLFEPNLSAALKVVDDAIGEPTPLKERPDRVILFTGHMVDAPDRDPSRMRFPRTAEAEARARALIEQGVKGEIAKGGSIVGIAGGACGSDILFHEVCSTLLVETRLFLPLPPAKFQVASVQRGGPDWVERYEKLCERVPPRVLQESEALPSWLVGKPDYNVWQRNNEWMLFNAIATGAQRLTLIALYNPDLDPDGPGGTKHLIQLGRRWGFKTVELDARALSPS